MQVEVKTISNRGKELSKSERMRGPAVRGELRFFENRVHRLGRAVTCATLTSSLDGTGTGLLPELLDARLIWLDGKTLRITGSEQVDQVNFVQTWEARVL